MFVFYDSDKGFSAAAAAAAAAFLFSCSPLVASSSLSSSSDHLPLLLPPFCTLLLLALWSWLCASYFLGGSTSGGGVCLREKSLIDDDRSVSRVFFCVAFRRKCNMQAGPRRKTSPVNTPSLLHPSCLGFFGGGDLDERGRGCLQEKSSGVLCW